MNIKIKNEMRSFVLAAKCLNQRLDKRSPQSSVQRGKRESEEGNGE